MLGQPGGAEAVQGSGPKDKGHSRVQLALRIQGSSSTGPTKGEWNIPRKVPLSLPCTRQLGLRVSALDMHRLLFLLFPKQHSVTAITQHLHWVSVISTVAPPSAGRYLPEAHGCPESGIAPNPIDTLFFLYIHTCDKV